MTLKQKSHESDENDNENCGICYKKYKEGEDWICCDNSTVWYHRQCVALELWGKYTIQDVQ